MGRKDIKRSFLCTLGIHYDWNLEFILERMYKNNTNIKTKAKEFLWPST